MTNFLSNTDYKSILNYYKIPITQNMTNSELKLKAENILASKLCKCIKKVDSINNESRAIALCRNAVLQKKGFDIYKFSCKKKAKLIAKKNTKLKLFKIKSKKTIKNIKK